MHSIEYKGELEDIKFKRVHSNLQSLRLGGDHIGFVSGDSKRGWNAVPAYKQQVPSKFGQARGFKTRLDAAFWIVKITGIEEMY